jgi:hypothetical protein
MHVPGPSRTIRKRTRKSAMKPLRSGTLVVPQSFRKPTMVLDEPRSGVGGFSVQPGTTLKVLGHKRGWHEVETMGDDKERGWISTASGTGLRPQLNVPRCDRPYVEYQPVDGPIYTGPVSVEDINQGYLGDCFLVGALAALADKAPGKIRDAIRRGDKAGTYVVTLHRVSDNGRNYGERTIEINNVFPTKDGQLLYAQGGKERNSRYEIDEFEDADRPLWPAILEKAFATMLGGYDKLDQGGIEETVFRGVTGMHVEDIELGRPGSEQNMIALSDLDLAIKMGLPVTASSKGRKVLPNIYDNHVYIAVGVTEDKVIIRNPHDPRKTMALSHHDFCRAFESLCVGCIETK